MTTLHPVRHLNVVPDAISDHSPMPALTKREVEVLRLIASGLGNQDIANLLFLSINSVKTYVRTAYRKIGVTSRTQAVIWVLTRDHEDDAAPSPTSAVIDKPSPFCG